ncbi:MAG: threonylcarbamoyl-AMP synthase [Clostridiales bacterium]|nr:threonylcarbamoyl-AMP synthase [Clostridiales bacterium]
MKTEILSEEEINIAANILKSGGIIAFPTETVYGLGAYAFNEKVVKNIFEVKKRAFNKPLTVHISKKNHAKFIAELNEISLALIDVFWPGPLTIIFKKKCLRLSILTSTNETVAIRLPSNKIAQKIIEKSGFFIAATSVNISGEPSSICYKQVIDEMDGKIDAIVYCKNCEIGVESTIVDISNNELVIKRIGAISLEKIEEAIGKIGKRIDKT